MQSYRDLTVYKKGFDLAMEIFEITKRFPKEETYSLTDQIRRSSRSVCTCIGEAYRKRLYRSHWIAKCSDADMENTETQIWLDFSLACKYINQTVYATLISKSEEVGKMIHHMMANPECYINKSEKNKT